MTRLMILGLLSSRAMTGYEIQHELQLYHADKWAGILSGSVYHALKKLEQEGMIELDLVEKTGNRSKASYKLTEKGNAELYSLLVDSLKQGSVVYPTTLYTGLTFLHMLPKDIAVEAINMQKSTLEKELDMMKGGQSEKESVYNMPEHVRAIFDNIYDHIELQISFLSKLKGIIEKTP